MEIENFEQKKQILSNLLIDGFDNANYSHKLLFKSELDDEKEFDKQKDLMCALTYLNQAHASFTNAYTLLLLTMNFLVVVKNLTTYYISSLNLIQNS